MLSPAHLRKRALKIKLLLLDVDGVMTDGRIYYLPNPKGGFFETKTFHARDGLGIRFAIQGGLKTGILSGRTSPVVEYRARELGIQFIQQRAIEKVEPYEKILRAAGVTDEEVCYMGDDVVDLPILIRAGLAVGVKDGHELVRRHIHYCTRATGGKGAVREAVELILAAQGKWNAVVKHYLGGKG
ncbi:MAG TPA: HAD family hydrolase [Terriglobia bacterium]|nr:HAD family hydrolase [Terriglobia bacterium]